MVPPPKNVQKSPQLIQKSPQNNAKIFPKIQKNPQT
jgi:hypothetical protein